MKTVNVQHHVFMIYGGANLVQNGAQYILLGRTTHIFELNTGSSISLVWYDLINGCDFIHSIIRTAPCVVEEV